MNDQLGSAEVPDPGAEDWIRGPAGAGLVLIEYADFECPFCAALWERLKVGDSAAGGVGSAGGAGWAGAGSAGGAGWAGGAGSAGAAGSAGRAGPPGHAGSAQRHLQVFRHFPVKSAHPRAWAAACAAEAAGRQGKFWEMHDLLFADQARLEDPHLWERAERLGLDLERFDADRRSEEVAARVRRDFSAGVRAGVVTTPTVFASGRAYHGDALRSFVDSLRGG